MAATQSVPATVLAELGDRLGTEAALITDEVVSMVEETAPAMADRALGLHELLRTVSAESHAALVEALHSGELDLRPPDSAAALSYARRLAQAGLPSDTVAVLFQSLQHVYLRHVAHALAEIVTPERYVGYLPRLLDLSLSHGTAGYRDAISQYQELIDWSAQRRAAGQLTTIRAILNGQVNDVGLASRTLRFPVEGLVVGFVLRADDVEGSSPADVRRLIGELPAVRDVLVVALDDVNVAAWASLGGPPTRDEWSQGLGAQFFHVRAGLGEIGEGLEGFRSTHRQALQAYRVAALSPRSKLLAEYSDVASLAFLAEDPVAAQRWVEWALGNLAGPGDGNARLRSTLRHYLAVGENPSEAAQGLFVHRNTVTYRVNKAVSLLPDGLDGHRIDVALALDYLRWTD
ncbi:MAG TPA: helix-turn-helix domain-containing protein [Actinomycetaceae bacterium]|nr:helix-turn-helix domain-containing protein [Actinomycetaceae bacterium]